MATIKIVILRPVPIWNFVIRPERVIEIEEDIGRALVARGCAKEKAAYDEALAKRKATKAAKAAIPAEDKPKPARKKVAE